MENDPLIFESKGYPSIKIYDDYFEIKAIDFSKFRKFNYSNIKKVKHYDPNNNWWTKIYILGSISGHIFADDDPWVLKIKKKNGGSWEYKTSQKTNSEFNQVIKLIKIKLNKESE
ncbi:hypothetical protein [Aquimarina sp. 2201CG5-10]|uniref:hypothetical protein n=1 Tax=Aquimarina callyspongiae TaxID=3098150 RepID=UPI002AB3D018|nr:hypothetical protein [Aquimarina sp. 2201CG5-10]MDY8135463.1 hypothetical protein [Aquimarina sp. 2201CG5-10]